MIPTLYDAHETNFSTIGSGTLEGIIANKTHTITKTLDGAETGVFSLPRSHRLFNYIFPGNLVMLDSDMNNQKDIYQVSDTEKSSDGSMITVRLQQWTAAASNYVLLKEVAIDGYTPIQVLEKVKENLDRRCQFAFISDSKPVFKDTKVTYNFISPNAVIGGDNNSLQALTGYHIYRYRNIIQLSKGNPKKIYFKRGKNISGITMKRSLDKLVTRIIPYFTETNDKDKKIYQGDIVISQIEDKYGNIPHPIAVDYTDRLAYIDQKLEEKEKGQNLNGPNGEAIKEANRKEALSEKLKILPQLASNYFKENVGCDQPEYTVTVNVEDYGSKRIQKISIGDTAVVYDAKYDLTVELPICELEYDFTTDHYVKIVAGDKPLNLMGAVNNQVQSEIHKQNDYLDQVNETTVQAIASANGKNTNWYGEEPPNDNLGKDGDLYFQYGLNQNKSTIMWIKKNGHWVKLLVDGTDYALRASIDQSFLDQQKKIDQAVLNTTTLSNEVDATNSRLATLKTGYDGFQATVTNKFDNTNSQITQLSSLIQQKVDSSEAHSIASIEAGKIQMRVETEANGRSYLSLNGGRIFIGGELLTIDAKTKFSNGVIANNIKAGDIDAGKIAAGTMRGVNLIGSQHITLTNGSSNVDISPWGMTLTGSSPHIQIGSEAQHGNLKVFGDVNITNNLAVDGQMVWLFKRNAYLRVDHQTGYLYFHGGPGWSHNYRIKMDEV